MGFDIFAAGSGDFYYKREGCEDGSTLNAMKIIAILKELDTKTLLRFGISKEKGIIDEASPGITDLMIALGQREMVHNLSNAVCLLPMNPNASSGWIFVNATQVNWLLPNKVAAATYGFSTKGSPAADFLGTINYLLTHTHMINFGVLQHLSVVLTQFQQSIDDSMTPKLSITLTN
jgi:hypothetical protein